MLDDTPIHNAERDKAWQAFIKRKDVKALMQGKSDFKFPLDGSYDLWCIAWAKAWDSGFIQGYNAHVEQTDEKLDISKSDWVGLRALYLLLATDVSSAMSGEVNKIMSYYSDKYGYGKIVGAFGLLATDNAIRDTFSAPDVMWARGLNNAIFQNAYESE